MGYIVALSLILVVLVGSLVVAASAEKTYGELAAHEVVPYYDAFVEGLKKFTDKNEPGHVKDTRGPCADFRTMIDIFAYAYPNSTGKKGTADAHVDAYLILLEDLTAGHNILGEYSDLGSVPFTKKEKEHVLGKCLQWKSTFEKHSDEYDYPHYIRHPSENKLYFRSKSDLSGHFWKHVKAVPSSKLSGLQNIAVLQDGELKQIDDLYSKFQHYTDIWNQKVHDDFHNYRKDLRYLHQTYSRFKAIYTDAKKAEKGLDLVDATEHQLGPINNRIEEFFYYEKKGDKKESEKLKSQIKELWEAEKARLKKEGFLDIMKELRNKLIKH